jgi:hypothetical protein
MAAWCEVSSLHQDATMEETVMSEDHGLDGL